jgi:hypothetical protein
MMHSVGKTERHRWAIYFAFARKLFASQDVMQGTGMTMFVVVSAERA